MESQINHKRTSYLVTIVIATVSYILGGYTGFFLGSSPSIQQRNSNKIQNVYIPTDKLKQPLPTYTPTPTTATNANWKVFANKELGFTFSYPPTWNLTESNHVGIGKASPDDFTVNTVGTYNTQYGQFVVYNEIVILDTMNGSIEERSEKYINHIMSYIPGVSYYSPKITSKSKIEIDGKAAMQYSLLLNQEDRPYSKATYVFIFEDMKLITIVFNGDDLEIFNEILTTFKFLREADQFIHTTCNTIRNLPINPNRGISFAEAYCIGHGCNTATSESDCNVRDIVKVENNTFISGSDGQIDCKWMKNLCIQNK